MTYRKLSTWLAAIAALSMFLAQLDVRAAGPIGKKADCVCEPDTLTFGFYPARWRPWPTHGHYGIPTPAMTPHPGHAPEELPTGPSMEGPAQEPDRSPGEPSTEPMLPDRPLDTTPPDTTPPDTAPPDNTPPDAPGPGVPDTRPDETAPENTPEPGPTAPPPATPGELPEDPLLPLPEEGDDAPPMPPQSLLEPAEEWAPRISTAGRAMNYLSDEAAEAGVDETGLPRLPAASRRGAVGAGRITPVPETAPNLLEPTPAAQPVPADDNSAWTGGRRNPLRASAPRFDESVQQAAHWQSRRTTVASAPAAKELRPGTSSTAESPMRENPLRSRGSR